MSPSYTSLSLDDFLWPPRWPRMTFHDHQVWNSHNRQMWTWPLVDPSRPLVDLHICGRWQDDPGSDCLLFQTSQLSETKMHTFVCLWSWLNPLSHQTAMPQQLYSVLKNYQRAVGSPRNTPNIFILPVLVCTQGPHSVLIFLRVVKMFKITQDLQHV